MKKGIGTSLMKKETLHINGVLNVFKNKRE